MDAADPSYEARMRTVAEMLDRPTVAVLIEAAELHATALSTLADRQPDTGVRMELGREANRLRAAVGVLRVVNGMRDYLIAKPAGGSDAH